jgi:hypothetical protein
MAMSSSNADAESTMQRCFEVNGHSLKLVATSVALVMLHAF